MWLGVRSGRGLLGGRVSGVEGVVGGYGKWRGQVHSASERLYEAVVFNSRRLPIIQ